MVASGDDDAERVYSIKPTSDGGVMLIGYEWSAFVSAPMAVKLDSQGTVDINFGDQGLFRTMTTSKHLKGLAQLNTMIETNDYYVFFGSQNFGGYAGLKLEYYVEEIEKTVFGRNNDLTMLVVNKNGTFADTDTNVDSSFCKDCSLGRYSDERGMQKDIGAVNDLLDW